MHDVDATWASRELPVLAAIVRRLDAGADLVNADDVRAETGLSGVQVCVALRALDADSFLEYEQTAGEIDAEHATGFVAVVYGQARRAVGSWPEPENLAAQIAAALRDAAAAEPDEEKKGKLRAAAEVVGGIARSVVIEALAARIGRL